MAADRVERRLRRRLRELDSVLVALSGGVDSSVITALAADELGPKAEAVTGVSPSLAQNELEAIAQLCRDLDIRHTAIDTHELQVEGYVENSPARCFFCKQELYGRLDALAKARSLRHIVDGTMAEDLAGHRPGHRAAQDIGVISPLVDVGATKRDVRRIARRLGLSNAERPSSPCLSSRIAYGVRVTPERLDRVGRSEAYLRGLGFSDVRVRLHDQIARVEVPADEIARATELAPAIAEALEALGFTYVTLDLAGLRSGSLLKAVRKA